MGKDTIFMIPLAGTTRQILRQVALLVCWVINTTFVPKF